MYETAGLRMGARTCYVGKVVGRLVAAGELGAQRRLEHAQPQPHRRQRACAARRLSISAVQYSQTDGRVAYCAAAAVRLPWPQIALAQAQTLTLTHLNPHRKYMCRSICRSRQTRNTLVSTVDMTWAATTATGRPPISIQTLQS